MTTLSERVAEYEAARNQGARIAGPGSSGADKLITDLDAERLRLEGENESLRAKLREAEVDAGRYQWVMENCHIIRDEIGARGSDETSGYRVSLIFDVGLTPLPSTSTSVGAAIDAAIAAAKEGK